MAGAVIVSRNKPQVTTNLCNIIRNKVPRATRTRLVTCSCSVKVVLNDELRFDDVVVVVVVDVADQVVGRHQNRFAAELGFASQAENLKRNKNVDQSSERCHRLESRGPRFESFLIVNVTSNMFPIHSSK